MFLKQGINVCGYPMIRIVNDKNKKTTYIIHRLVALLFVDNPLHLKEVNHKDGNKTNNNANNLEWVTRGQNIKHAYDHGLRKSYIQYQRRPPSSIYFKKVGVFENNVLVKTYESLKSASISLGIKYSTLSCIIIRGYKNRIDARYI